MVRWFGRAWGNVRMSSGNTSLSASPDKISIAYLWNITAKNRATSQPSPPTLWLSLLSISSFYEILLLPMPLPTGVKALHLRSYLFFSLFSACKDIYHQQLGRVSVRFSSRKKRKNHGWVSKLSLLLLAACCLLLAATHQFQVCN